MLHAIPVASRQPFSAPLVSVREDKFLQINQKFILNNISSETSDS